MNAFINYLRAVRAELGQVTWPTYAQAVGYTALVIGISLIVALVLGAADFFLAFGLEQLIIR